MTPGKVFHVYYSVSGFWRDASTTMPIYKLRLLSKNVRRFLRMKGRKVNR